MCYLACICELKLHQSCPPPYWMLLNLGLTSNHQHYRQQLRARWLPSNPQGHPGPLAFIFFSMVASVIALQPSYTVLMVTSTCGVLPDQLTGPLKPSSTSCVLQYRSPSLSKHLPKNRTASPSNKTTALVIQSPRQASCNISAISDPLHAWEGGS